MANSDKNIRITTSRNKATLPNIVFTGSSAGSSVITLDVLDSNELRFSSNEGTVFSLNSNLSTGTIWSVNDISASPLLRASAGGTIGLAEFGTTFVGIGQSVPAYKLDVKGNVGFASTSDSTYSVLIDNTSAAGSNSLQLRAQNDLRFFNSANTFYTGFQAGNPAANTTYTWPATYPGSGTSVLASDTSGTMSWVAAGAGGGSGTMTSITAGSGISFSTGGTITTSGTVRIKRYYRLLFMSGYTPTAAGVDTVTFKVPDNIDTGASDEIYNCKEVFLRVETANAGTSTINIQKYAYAGGTGVSAFSTTSTGSTTNIMAAALSISGATTYETGTSSFAAGHGTCASGDKFRVNFTALNASHTNFTVSLLIEEQ
jgi:predicted secreted protein